MTTSGYQHKTHECIIKQITDQKAIGQPIAQSEHSIGNDTEHIVGNQQLVPRWSRGECGIGTRELTVINVASWKHAKAHCDEYSHNWEDDHSVRYESPFDTLPPAVDGIGECGQALKEQYCDDP